MWRRGHSFRADPTQTMHVHCDGVPREERNSDDVRDIKVIPAETPYNMRFATVPTKDEQEELEARMKGSKRKKKVRGRKEV